MKKTFNLVHPKTKYARLVEAMRCEIRKYLKRERKKALPEGIDFWDFDCKFGLTAEGADIIHVSEISAHITKASETNAESIYVEILAKPGKHPEKLRDSV